MNAPAANSNGTTSKEYIWNLAKLKGIARNGLKVFSCFSCGGGSCMGYKLAGFEVIGNNEIDKKINAMYVKNHKPKYNLNCDIREIINKNLPNEFYDLDILDGSPPCSTFSMAGSREKAWGVKKKFLEGQKLQRLDDLFFHFINFAERIKPKVVVAENVKGLILGKSKGYVNEIIKTFQKIGYQVQIFLLNSKYMGVPQARERVFFIARRKDLNLSNLKLNFNENPIKYGEFSDTNFKPIKSQSKAYELWKQRNKADNDLSRVNVRTGSKKSNFGMKLIHKDKVCPTITSGDYFLRFDAAGALSDKDFITVQTFPQDYDFCGRSVQYVCGMSVPPIMMKKIAEQIYKQILKE